MTGLGEFVLYIFILFYIITLFYLFDFFDFLDFLGTGKRGKVVAVEAAGLEVEAAMLEVKRRQEEERRQEAFSLLRKNPPQITDKITIPASLKGLLCIRQWKFENDPPLFLRSTNSSFVWKANNVVADRIPAKENESGIYAYLLGAQIPKWTDHIGLIELTGRVIVHADGIVRGEKAKIIALISRDSGHWGVTPEDFSSSYKVPCVITRDEAYAYYARWFLSEGWIYLEHNSKLLNKKSDFWSEIEEILKGRDL